MKADLNTVILLIGFIFVWLSNKRDLNEVRGYLSARIDRLGDKLDEINKALGKHEAEISNLKETPRPPKSGTNG